MASYFVKTGGSDAASGLSDALAWATIGKVNGVPFVAGDIIQFRRGDTWADVTLSPPTSGSLGNPIIYTAYGTGARPIIERYPILTGWTVSGNWTDMTGNVWRITSNLGTGARIILNGTMYFMAASSGAVNSTLRFYADGTNIYVYATSNPASFYTTMQMISSSSLAVEVNDGTLILNRDYLTIADLDLRGGGATIFCKGCNHIDITSVLFGYRAKWGATATGTNSDVAIHHSTYDSGVIGMSETHPTELGGDAIQFVMNNSGTMNGAKIHHNTFLDAPHTGISLSSTASAADQVINCEVYENDISCPNTNYGRGIDTTGTFENAVRLNRIHHNTVHHTKTPCQPNGNNNTWDHNVIAFMEQGKDNYNHCVVISSATAKVTHDNIFAHNVLYESLNYGLNMSSPAGSPAVTGNLIDNNIIMNWVTANGAFGVANDSLLQNNLFRNNLVYDAADNTSPILYKGTTYNATTFNALSIADNNLQGDPLFVNPAALDFRLTGSVAGTDYFGANITTGSQSSGYPGATFGNKATVWQCPGSGSRTLTELSAYGYVTTGPGLFLLAIYRASDLVRIAQGSALCTVVNVGSGAAAWVGHIGAANLTPNPATVVGGTNYIIVATWPGTGNAVFVLANTVASGNAGVNFADYTAGFPTPLPAQTNSTVLFNLRAGVVGTASASPAVDAGMVISGINDGYLGSAPDIGAFEFVATVTGLPVFQQAYRLQRA